MGNGLAIGAGIAKGAENFVNSYMQATQYENQQKMMKHQVILSALYKNLDDENLPYTERARIFDAIPGLMGIKLDAPLSHMMGLHDLLDKDVETGPTKVATPTTGKSGQVSTNAIEAPEVQSPDGSSVSMGVSDPGNTLNSTITQRGTEAETAKTEKFGDLSPARYKQLITTRQQSIDSEKQLENYRRKAEIDFELQQQSYKAQGYTRVVTEGFNTNGEYVVLMANASNDIKEVKMPKGFQPTKILAKSGTGLPPAIRVYTDYFQNQKNPLTGENFTPQEAHDEAVKLYKENGDVIADLRKKQIQTTTISGELRNTGQMPRTRAEIAADEDRNINREDRREDKITEAERTATEAAAKVADIGVTYSRIKAAYDEAEQAFNAWVMQNGDTGEGGALSAIFGKPDTSKLAKYNINGKTYFVDPEDLADDEVKVLRNNLDSRRKELEAIEAQKRTYEGTVKAQEQKINNLRKKSEGSTRQASSISQQQINTFRQNNANSEKVRTMTDEQIRELLERNRNRWQP